MADRWVLDTLVDWEARGLTPSQVHLLWMQQVIANVRERPRRFTVPRTGLRRRRYIKRWYDKGDTYLYHRNKHDMLNVEKLPCAKCGEKRRRLLQVDHIQARGLGGKSERENLQVLCYKHHKKKTRLDMRKIRMTKIA